MKPTLIGITGRAGAGKDTVAEALGFYAAYDRYSFALPLKLALKQMFGWNLEQWNNRQWKEAVDPALGKSPRQLAQTLGTEWGRELVHPDLWLILAAQHYTNVTAKLMTEGCNGLVIADVRFENEANFIHARGGQVWSIVRADTPEVAAHKSERQIPATMVDRVLVNDGTVRDLQACALRTLHAQGPRTVYARDPCTTPAEVR